MGVLKAMTSKANADLARDIQSLLADNGWDKNRLQVAIYGLDAKGKTKPSGGFFASINGHNRPTENSLHRWSNATGIPLADFRHIMNKYPPPVAITPAKAPPIRSLRPEPQDLLPATASDPEQFSLVISAEGRASIRLNMSDIPVPQAMKVIHALMSTGLLDTGDSIA